MGKKEKIIPAHYCRDCKLCTNHHNIGANGQFILGVCGIDRYNKLLNSEYCEKIKL